MSDHANEIGKLHELLAEKDAEIARLRSRLLMALGDDQCQFTAEELRDIADGKKKLPLKEIFLPSCAAFHDRHAGEHGVLENCLTLAQSLAESEGLRIELAAERTRFDWFIRAILSGKRPTLSTEQLARLGRATPAENPDVLRQIMDEVMQKEREASQPPQVLVANTPAATT